MERCNVLQEFRRAVGGCCCRADVGAGLGLHLVEGLAAVGHGLIEPPSGILPAAAGVDGERVEAVAVGRDARAGVDGEHVEADSEGLHPRDVALQLGVVVADEVDLRRCGDGVAELGLADTEARGGGAAQEALGVVVDRRARNSDGMELCFRYVVEGLLVGGNRGVLLLHLR
jgi:hypothetical protein